MLVYISCLCRDLMSHEHSFESGVYQHCFMTNDQKEMIAKIPQSTRSPIGIG